MVSTYLTYLLYPRHRNYNGKQDKPASKGLQYTRVSRELDCIMIAPYGGKHWWLWEHMGEPLGPVFGCKPVTAKLSSQGCIDVNQVRLERRECSRERNSAGKGLGKTTNTGVWGAGLVLNGWTLEQSEGAGEQGSWREGNSGCAAEMGAWDVTVLKVRSRWGVWRGQMTNRRIRMRDAPPGRPFEGCSSDLGSWPSKF